MRTLPTPLRDPHSQNEDHLRLYSTEYCSYCRKVQREASKLGVALRVMDVFTDRSARERLRAATGRTRVPVLGIMDESGQERFLPESDDIIFYLREHIKGADRSPPA